MVLELEKLSNILYTLWVKMVNYKVNIYTYFKVRKFSFRASSIYSGVTQYLYKY